MLSIAIPAATVLAQDAILDDGQEGGTRRLQLKPGSAVQINPLTGSLTATPADTPDWQACLGNSGNCQVSIDTFSLSRSTVGQGEDITLSWDARGGWQCAGSLQNGLGAAVTSTTWDDLDSRLPRGNASISTGSLDPGNYDAIINCSNGSSVEARAAFTVIDANPDAPAFCATEGRVPPSGMAQDTQILWATGVFPASPQLDQTVMWEQFFGFSFPKGDTVGMEILKDHYATLAFQTSNRPVGTQGKIQFELPQFSQSRLFPGDKLITISQCPGDFTNQVEDPECRLVINNGGFRWGIGTEPTVDFRCTLRQNTTYYMNILYTPDATASPLKWGCTGAESLDDHCGNLVDHLEDG
ncbi:MAG: hypothetical protein RQ826_15865 [Xanthomonadales bacterium]|nr:hypothetical protein [Xanthomonadales bacterium]